MSLTPAASARFCPIVVFRCGLAGALAASGILLPLDILGALDGLLLYLSPGDIVRTYSYGFFVHLVLGGLAGGAVGILSLVRVWVSGYITEEKKTAVFIHATAFVFAVFLGLVRWLPGSGLHALRDSLREVGYVVTVGGAVLVIAPAVAFVTVWRSGTIGLGVQSLAQIGALCGLCGCASLFVGGVKPRSTSGGPSDFVLAGPRIVLVTIDTLTAAHMSLYGYGPDTSPEFVRFGAQSHVFSRHHANGNFTTAGINSILYGVRPWEHRGLQLPAKSVVVNRSQGFVEGLANRQYETFAVSTNFWASAEHAGCARSVKRSAHASVGLAGRLIDQWPDAAPLETSSFTFRLINSVVGLLHRDTADINADNSFSLARVLLGGEQTGRPAFLWVHLFPPHAPYTAPAALQGMFGQAGGRCGVDRSQPPTLFEASLYPEFPSCFVGAYDESVRHVDDAVGRFLRWLQDQGLYEDSLIIVTSDHGESFSHSFGQHTGPLLHEDLIHIPLIIKLPHQKEGKRISALTEQADILPTVQDLLGLPISTQTEGRSLRPLMEGRDDDPEHAVYSMNFEQNSVFKALTTGSVAMLQGHYKYVHYFGKIHYPHMPKLTDALYDLTADPGENRDLRGEMPELAASMLGSIEAQIQAHSLPPSAR